MNTSSFEDLQKIKGELKKGGDKNNRDINRDIKVAFKRADKIKKELTALIEQLEYKVENSKESKYKDLLKEREGLLREYNQQRKQFKDSGFEKNQDVFRSAKEFIENIDFDDEKMIIKKLKIFKKEEIEKFKSLIQERDEITELLYTSKEILKELPENEDIKNKITKYEKKIKDIDYDMAEIQSRLEEKLEKKKEELLQQLEAERKKYAEGEYKKENPVIQEIEEKIAAIEQNEDVFSVLYDEASVMNNSKETKEAKREKKGAAGDQTDNRQKDEIEKAPKGQKKARRRVQASQENLFSPDSSKNVMYGEAVNAVDTLEKIQDNIRRLVGKIIYQYWQNLNKAEPGDVQILKKEIFSRQAAAQIGKELSRIKTYSDLLKRDEESDDPDDKLKDRKGLEKSLAKSNNELNRLLSEAITEYINQIKDNKQGNKKINKLRNLLIKGIKELDADELIKVKRYFNIWADDEQNSNNDEEDVDFLAKKKKDDYFKCQKFLNEIDQIRISGDKITREEKAKKYFSRKAEVFKNHQKLTEILGKSVLEALEKREEELAQEEEKNGSEKQEKKPSSKENEKKEIKNSQKDYKEVDGEKEIFHIFINESVALRGMNRRKEVKKVQGEVKIEKIGDEKYKIIALKGDNLNLKFHVGTVYLERALPSSLKNKIAELNKE